MTPGVVVMLIGAGVLASRVYLPWARRPAGIRIARVRLSLLGRLRLHWRVVFGVIAVGAVAWLVGWLPPPLALILLAGNSSFIALPVRYTVTTEAIVLGRTRPRRWMEFGGVARRPGGVRLQGVAGARSMTVWLSGRPDDDDFVLLLRKLVRGSYQGQFGAATTNVPPSRPTVALAGRGQPDAPDQALSATRRGAEHSTGSSTPSE